MKSLIQIEFMLGQRSRPHWMMDILIRIVILLYQIQVCAFSFDAVEQSVLRNYWLLKCILFFTALLELLLVNVQSWFWRVFLFVTLVLVLNQLLRLIKCFCINLVVIFLSVIVLFKFLSYSCFEHSWISFHLLAIDFLVFYYWDQLSWVQTVRSTTCLIHHWGILTITGFQLTFNTFLSKIAWLVYKPELWLGHSFLQIFIFLRAI
jgi:hypothetical protein